MLLYNNEVALTLITTQFFESLYHFNFQLLNRFDDIIKILMSTILIYNHLINSKFIFDNFFRNLYMKE